MPIFTTIPLDPIPIAKSTVWLQVSSAKMVKKIPAEISGIPNIPTPTPSPSGPSDLVAVDLGRGGMNQAAPPLPPLGRQLLLRYVMGICPPVICYIAIENGPFIVYPFKMVISIVMYSYVSLPEGNWEINEVCPQKKCNISMRKMMRI